MILMPGGRGGARALLDMIRLNMDESFDAMDLVGSYVCTSQPGVFEWKPGPLVLVCSSFSSLLFLPSLFLFFLFVSF